MFVSDFFFFKQKTAYEMRISDWSSDVCSSDLGHAVHDNAIQSFVLIDRLETWDADSGTGLEWKGLGWVGTDLNRLWVRSEGERVDGTNESADVEVLYGRSFEPWWDVVAGVRQEFDPGT